MHALRHIGLMCTAIRGAMSIMNINIAACMHVSDADVCHMVT